MKDLPENSKKVNEYTVVLIDVSEADRYLIKHCFNENLNYEFSILEYPTFDDFRANIPEILGQNIDAILIDFHIDKRPADKICNEIKNHFSSVPIISMNRTMTQHKAMVTGKLGIINFIDKSDLTSERLLSCFFHSINLFESVKQSIIKANYDALTGLANRSKLEDRVEHALALAKRNEKTLALMLVDMDDFKLINDNYGHDVGDIFLQTIAGRLQDCVRVSDTVARLGGDEFAILLEGIEYAEISINLAKKIINNINEPLFIKGKKIKPSLSIGLSMMQKNNKNRFSYDWLFQSADKALYEAKKKGKNTYAVYTDKSDAEMIYNLKLEDELIEAIEKKEFCMFYQPIFDLQTQKVCGAEALLRWINKEYKTITPDKFLSVIVKLGLMKELGDFVIEESLKQYAKWQLKLNSQNSDFCLHINIAAAQFLNAGFYDYLKDNIEKYAVPVNNIELELTEQNLFNNSKHLQREFAKLDFLGVKLAVDDFGTGYNSFDYIRRFKFDSLKLDKSFVKSMFNNSVDMAIVESMTKFAQSLDVGVIAEGVETKEQLEYLAKLGVNQIQGYYKGKPVNAIEFEKRFLQNNIHVIKSETLSRVANL